MAMLDRMKTGRLKVFASLGAWFGEFRLYHRKDGLIVKARDDLLAPVSNPSIAIGRQSEPVLCAFAQRAAVASGAAMVR